MCGEGMREICVERDVHHFGNRNKDVVDMNGKRERPSPGYIGHLGVVSTSAADAPSKLS